VSADVEVWAAWLDVGDELGRRLAATLSPEERAQADRFRAVPLPQRFVAAHGVLRAVLAHHLRGDPRDVVFVREPRGKLRLPGEPLRFNLSHSDDLAVVAVTRDHEIGVDVERVRSEVPALSIAERFFSPEERDALQAVGHSRRAHAFFHLWTSKEAYLKALGTGITSGLDDSPRPDCTVVPFHVAPGYAAAVAVRRCEPRERCSVTLRIAILDLEAAPPRLVSRLAPRPPASSAA